MRLKAILLVIPLLLVCLSFFSACTTPGPEPARSESPAIVPASPAPRTRAPAPGNGDIGDFRNWEVTDFAGHGEVDLAPNMAKIEMGAMLSGITWTNTGIIPKRNYSVSFEVKKTSGSDFFCGLTFPVGTNFCSLIVGGWGGGIVGLSSINDMDASENETSQSLYFEPDRWFKINLQVLEAQYIRVSIDDKRVISIDTKGKKVDLRPGDIYKNIPLGICTYQTSAQIRNFKLREIVY